MLTTGQMPATNPSPKLNIIIVSWNTKDLLRDCLRTLPRRTPEFPFEVIVIDNASNDGSPEMVAAQFPEVRLLRNSENVGFARANEQAAALAHGEYLLLLNSDTLLQEPDILKRWVDYMDRHPAVGVSGCQLLWPDGRHQVGDAGFRPSLRSLLGHFWSLSSLAFSVFPPLFLGRRRFREPIDVDWVSGAACLVRRSILPRTGFLESRIFMYAEDIEWCCRIRDHGYRITYLPQVHIVHLQGGSSRKQTAAGFPVLWLANLRALYFLHNPREPRFVFDSVVAVGLAVRIAIYSLGVLGPHRSRTRERIRHLERYLRYLLAKFGRPATALYARPDDAARRSATGAAV